MNHQTGFARTLAALKKRTPLFHLSDIAPSHDESKYLPAPVAGFVQSRHGNYLLLTNKERLRVGALLPNGEKSIWSADVVTIKHYDTLF